MIADFDRAQERLRDVKRRLETLGSSRADAVGGRRSLGVVTSTDDFDLLRCLVRDSIDAVCVGLPSTAERYSDLVSATDTPEDLHAIVQDLLDIAPPTRMQVSGDGDAAYFSILVERSLLGSRLFKYAIGAVVLMIGISLGIVGWEISTVGDLTAQVDAKLHEARRILDEKQSAMDSQIANATRLGKEIQRDAELVEEEKERARRELNRLRGDVEGVQATLEKMRSELRGVRGAWDAEKAGWDKELAQIQGFFDEQKAEVRKAVTSTIGELAPLLTAVRAKEAEVDGLARQASASAAAAAADAGDASAQSEAAQTHASKAQSEGEQVERLRERVDSIHTGLNAKVAAAESAAAAALESVDRLTQRLDGKRQDFENALASGVELEERLNRELQGMGAAIDAWRKRTEDAVVQVEEQAAEASATLRERSAEPLSVLQGRRDRAKEIVEGLVRRESDAREYLGRLEEIQSKARDQYEATADASSEVSALLRDSEGQRAVLAALFGQVDDRREEAEKELAILLDAQPALDLANTWQSVLQRERSGLALVAAAVALLIGVTALLVALLRRRVPAPV